MASSVAEQKERATAAFREAFGQWPEIVVAAPGRVNLIGEHTDYNEGYVLPVAIDRQVVIAAAKRDDNIVSLRALDLNSTSEFSLSEIAKDPDQPWSNYQRGVAWVIKRKAFPVGGINAVITGNVPIGAGLSSSAAVEVATAYTFRQLYDLPMTLTNVMLICQSAENEFVGMRCGIMDQCISTLGKRDHALLIDCRTLVYRSVPVPTGVAIVVCDSKVQRGLVDSQYNMRRLACETGARLLGVHALRDVTPEMFEERAMMLPEMIRRRCRHVVYENQRVLDGVAALQRGDLATFGALMYRSHASLRDDYEVSCRELNILVEAASEVEGVYGSRLTGAGFGGCTVSLVDAGRVETFQTHVAARYEAATGVMPPIYVCRAEDGVRVLEK